MKFKDYIPEVRLLAESRGILGPEEIVAYGANACIKKDDPVTLYMEHVKQNRDISGFVDRVLRATIDSGHLSVLDQASFSFIFRNIPRVTTLFMVMPVFLSHLQQSMRSVEPYGYYLPDVIKGTDLSDEFERIMGESLGLYYRMVHAGIPKEDARYVVPLYVVTNLQTTGNSRSFTHLYLMSMDEGVPSVTRKVIGSLWTLLKDKYPRLFKERDSNMARHKYYPSPQLFSKKGNWIYNAHFEERVNAKLIGRYEPFSLTADMLKDALEHGDEYTLNLLKHVEYTFLIKISLTTLHQVLRQRTWWHIVEPIYRALRRLEYVIPPEVRRRGYVKDFKGQVEKQYYFYHKLIDRGVPIEDAVGIVAHAHTIYDIIRVDGWNLIGALPLRRCLKAQWEIRFIANTISNYVAHINRDLSNLSSPSCVVFGKCSEKYPCIQKEIFLSRKAII